MAKILKQFGFKQKKNPPLPPQPDYEGDVGAKGPTDPFADHHYANIGSFISAKPNIHFQEKEESKLVVFQDYSEPSDLRSELAALRGEDYDPLYMAPVDQMTNSCFNQCDLDDEVYCVPYEDAPPPLPSPCFNTVGSSFRADVDEFSRADSPSSSAYDVVPDLSHDTDDILEQVSATLYGEEPGTSRADKVSLRRKSEDVRPCDEYDEPWEWGVAAKFTSSIQASPSSPGFISVDVGQDEHTYSEPTVSPQATSCDLLLSDSESCCCVADDEEEDDEMTTRQRRLYETAFDSRVKKDIDDIDRLMQSPVLQGDIFRPRIKPGETGPVLRTASRSSFGSTSGSSTSSTPTHQPQMVSKPSPRPRHYPLHFTPTERRKVTLIRDHLPVRSCSPLSRPIKVIANVEPNQFARNSNNRTPDNNRLINFERQFGNNRWDNTSRCSDKSSSSQESMDQKDDFASVLPPRRNSQDPLPRIFSLGKSASRDSIATTYREPVPTSVAANKNLNNKVNDLSMFVRTVGSPNLTNKKPHESLNQKDSIDENSPFTARKSAAGHPGVKVLPTDNGRPSVKSGDKPSPTNEVTPPVHPVLSLKEEVNSSCTPASSVLSTSEDNDEKPKPSKPARPCSLVANGIYKFEPGQSQSPQNDERPSDDYDPPWEFRKTSQIMRSNVNASKSMPDGLSKSATNDLVVLLSSDKPAVLPLERTEDDVAPSDLSSSNVNEAINVSSSPPCLPKPSKPPGPIARPNLNLNLNLNSDSPRKARQSLTLNFGCAALSAVGEKVDADLTLEKQGWYHGSISRHDAENLLRVLKEGSYLVRNSESSKQDYSLSLKSARGFMHMKIVHSEGHFILGQFSNPFSSIPEMIHHYSINKLPIKGAEHMSLLYPVIDQLL